MIGGLEAPGAEFEVLAGGQRDGDDNAVIVQYKVGASGPHWLACQFAGAADADGVRRLLGVTSDRWGEISQVRLFLLQRYWLDEATEAPPRKP